MRNKIILSVTALLAVLALAAFLAPKPALTAPVQQVDNEAALHTIIVNGEGKVSLKPDIAWITIGVTTENKEAAKAVKENNAKAQEVLNQLKKSGIAEEDIQTTNFSVYPRQQYDTNNKPTGTIYSVENSVKVRVKDLAKTGEILDLVVNAGANTISNIQFDVADPSKAYDQALQEAVKDAYAKAKVAADAAGVKLGPVHTIQISSGNNVMPYASKMLAAAPAAAADVSISPGQMDITVDVSVVYLIGG